MKLILTQEVTGLGSAGDVVEVKDGYGRNYLIPRGFGIRWTRGGEKTIESITEGGGEVDKRTIVVGNPIKSLGAHTVKVKLHDDVEAEVHLNVVSA